MAMYGARSFVAGIDGAITFVEAADDDPADEAAARRRRNQREDPAQGWSSAVPDRGLGLRRRRGRSSAAAGAAASCSRQRGGSVRTTAGEERGYRVEEVAAPGGRRIGGKAMAAKAQVVLDTVAFDYLVVH